MPYANPQDKVAQGKRRYATLGPKIRAQVQRYYYLNRKRIRRRRLVLNRRFLKKNAERERLRYARWREEAVTAYGGRCSCCGEAEPLFLEIDHKNNDGATHRRRHGRSAKALIKWLKDHRWPRDRFQLLCANCNQGKNRNGGECPHLGKGQSSSRGR